MIDYKLIFDQIPDASMIVDINTYVILESNEAFKRFFTIPSREQSFLYMYTYVDITVNSGLTIANVDILVPRQSSCC